MTLPPSSPPQRALLELLQEPERLAAVRQAARLLFPESVTGFVRVLFLACGFPVPPSRTPTRFLLGCARLGWRPVGAPRSGDLFVMLDAAGDPCRVGLVQKVSVDGEWFYAWDEQEDRSREAVLSVDRFLRPPG